MRRFCRLHANAAIGAKHNETHEREHISFLRKKNGIKMYLNDTIEVVQLFY